MSNFRAFLALLGSASQPPSFPGLYVQEGSRPSQHTAKSACEHMRCTDPADGPLPAMLSPIPRKAHAAPSLQHHRSTYGVGRHPSNFCPQCSWGIPSQ
eukprot:4679779-Amphidinium_carterae.1